MVDFLLAVGIGFLAMILYFVKVRVSMDHYMNSTFYYANLGFVFIFVMITIAYDLVFGLTEIKRLENGGLLFTNSVFYERTLAINHAIILGTVFLMGYSGFKRLWKNLLISTLTLGVIFLYFYIIDL